jgi:Capsule polysaccharide biosynthesis protein
MSLNKNSTQPIVLVPHYLSVEVYAQLAFNLTKLSGCDTHLLVLSDADKQKTLVEGVPQENVRSYESALRKKELDSFDLEQLEEKYPNVPWGTVVAAERSFTDYSYTFGGTGERLERDNYIVPLVLRLIAYFDAEFDRLKPRAVVTVFGDNIYTHIAAIVAEQKEIPFLLPHASYMNEGGKLASGYFANTRFLESFAMVRSYLEYKSRDLTEEERNRAEAFAESLRTYEGTKTLHFIYKKKDFEKPITPNLKKIFSYIKDHHELNKNVYFYKIDMVRKFKANLYRFIRYRTTARFLARQPITLPESRIVFFPMHFQPEASTLINGIWYSNQIGLIENLSKALPLGYTLVVKEHPRGRGMRPLWQYRHIASLHNVQFCDLPSKEILQRADVTVTISGSIGLEGLAMKKPVVMLGRTFHSFNTVYYRANSMEQLTFVLQDILLKNDFEKIPNLQDEIYKVLLSYLNALFHFSPFGENRQGLAQAVLDELEYSIDDAYEWIASLFNLNVNNKEVPKKQLDLNEVNLISKNELTKGYK